MYPLVAYAYGGFGFQLDLRTNFLLPANEQEGPAILRSLRDRTAMLVLTIRPSAAVMVKREAGVDTDSPYELSYRRAALLDFRLTDMDGRPLPTAAKLTNN
ncbi:hypothetical protein IP88_09650 [alpha proteobacterium AAP81b]|nr:hypothetical protein IP88_09650 [alpha proteobacterium AAP81b]